MEASWRLLAFDHLRLADGRSMQFCHHANIDQTAPPCVCGSSDKGQTVENQLARLQEAAQRLGWTVVAVCFW
jgi:hypothetical protein